MSRSLRVRADLVPQVELAVKRNGFLRKKDLAEALEMAESTVRKFRTGKPVDHAIFVEICQKLNLEWQDFADFGEITELHQASEEAVTARYSTSKTEKTTPDTFDLAEREEAIVKSHRDSVESDTTSIEERYFRATSNFDSLEPLERKSRIQVLEEIAIDSPRYHWKVMEFLAAFVRRKAPRREEEEAQKERSPKLSEDIQAALTVIGQRNWKNDPPNQRLDLSITDLRGANLREAQLQGSNLSAAQLQGADFCEAKLQGAYLIKANLKEAQLVMANLEGAYIHQANLEEAKFLEAILRRTKTPEANLKKADFYNADLGFADLWKTNLESAKFDFAKLTRTQLSQANLRETFLIGADLKGTNFSETDVKLKQIEYAFGDSTTVLPNDFKDQPIGCKPGECQERSSFT